MKYTRADVRKVFDQVWEEILKLREAGQKEYAHGEDTPFRNFEALGQEMRLLPPQVLWVYAMKHKDGIVAWLNGETSQREDVTGRINDLIVYLILLRAMIEENRASIKEMDTPEKRSSLHHIEASVSPSVVNVVLRQGGREKFAILQFGDGTVRTFAASGDCEVVQERRP